VWAGVLNAACRIQAFDACTYVLVLVCWRVALLLLPSRLGAACCIQVFNACNACTGYVLTHSVAVASSIFLKPQDLHMHCMWHIHRSIKKVK
jgi:hypothetical protein